MSKSIQKFILAFGFLALAHAAYSATQCKLEVVILSAVITKI